MERAFTYLIWSESDAIIFTAWTIAPVLSWLLVQAVSYPALDKIMLIAGLSYQGVGLSSIAVVRTRVKDSEVLAAGLTTFVYIMNPPSSIRESKCGVLESG